MENAAQVNQPMTEKSAVQADDHPVHLQHHRPPAGDLPAHRRRRGRALPRPALLADRVQRPLAGLAGRGHGQVLGHRDRPGRRLVARRLGRHPPGDRADRHGPAVPAEREVALPAQAQRVRPSASSTCRSRTTPWPWPAGTSPVCRPSSGATTTRTPRGRSGAAGSSSPSSSPASPTTSATPWSAGTLGGLLGLQGPGGRLTAEPRAPLRRAGRRRHRSGAGDRAGLRPPAGRARRPRRGQRPRRCHGRHRRGHGPGGGGRRRDRRIRWLGAAPTPTTSPAPEGREALVDAALERFGRLDVLDQQRRDHPMGRLPRGRRGEPDAGT